MNITKCLMHPRFFLPMSVLALVFSVPVTADQYRVNAKNLSEALMEFSRQSGAEIIFPSRDLQGISSPVLVGNYSVEEGLQALLEGTGLTYSRDKNNVIFIQASSSGADSQATGPSLEKSKRGMEIEEITVTAQKREQSLKDVPISITALSGNELKDRNIASFEDLALAVPGLVSTGDGGTGTRYLFMRGIANVSGNQGGTIGMYLDEAPVAGALNSNANIRTYDLARVEALRGPQGTLYGQGSMGGVLRLIPNLPNLEETEGWAEASSSHTNGGDFNGRAAGAISLPLIKNQLAVRLAGEFHHQGGWIDSPQTETKNVNTSSLKDFRGTLLWKPVEDLEVFLMANIHDNDTGAQSSYGDEQMHLFTGVFGETSPTSTYGDHHVYNAKITYDFGPAELVSSTTYFDYLTKLLNRGQASLPTSPPPAGPVFFYFDDLDLGAEVFSQELRLQSEPGKFEWEIGGFYRDYVFTQRNTISIGFDIDTVAIGPLVGAADQTSESYAAFGNVSLDIGDRIEIGGGLRYFEDEISVVLLPSGTVLKTATFDSISPRGFINFDLTNDVKAYANVAKGFRSGRNNTSAIVPDAGPETVWTYELGLKGEFFGGDLYAEVAAYYSDYSGYQTGGLVFFEDSYVNIVSNSGDAEIKGVDALISWTPTTGFELSLTGNFNDGEIVKQAATNTPLEAGDSLDFIPDYQFGIAATKYFQLAGRNGSLFVAYNQKGKSRLTERRRGDLDAIVSSDVVHSLSGKFKIDLNDKFEINIFADNLLNRYELQAPSFGGGFYGTYTRPRTVGVGMRAIF